MEYRELKQEAKKLGIPTYGKKKEQIEEELDQHVSGGALSAPIEEQKKEAKEARTERRSRRGGALLGKGEYKLNRKEYLREGFHRRWFKDEGGRLSSAEGNDYDFVLNKSGQHITVRSGTNRDGSLRTLHLMEKRLDWYNEDQLAKRETDRAKEGLLKEGKIADASFNAAARDLTMYQPKEGVAITNSIIKK